MHSFRGDDKLFQAFKPVAKAYFGSICNAYESFMVGVIGIHQNPNVNISNTVNIDSFEVNRIGRNRRLLPYEEPSGDLKSLKDELDVRKALKELVPRLSRLRVNVPREISREEQEAHWVLQREARMRGERVPPIQVDDGIHRVHASVYNRGIEEFSKFAKLYGKSEELDTLIDEGMEIIRTAEVVDYR